MRRRRGGGRPLNQLRVSADHKKPSPFSILRSSRNEDIEEEFRRSEHLGFRNTRASLLKNLHLKKQLKENPALTRFPKEVI